MNTNYHIEITRLALKKHFSERALEIIVAANINQDRIAHLIGHDYIHFDGSAFEEGFAYIAAQESQLIYHLKEGKIQQAQQVLGRITHSWQDFFSHSNYVDLWLQSHPNQTPAGIIIDDQNILNHPEFASGKNYGLLELLTMLPGIKKLVMPLMPKDSHACMNLDSPAEGENFEYAYWAAVKATQAAHAKIIKTIHNHDALVDIINQFEDR